MWGYKIVDAGQGDRPLSRTKFRVAVEPGCKQEGAYHKVELKIRKG